MTVYQTFQLENSIEAKNSENNSFIELTEPTAGDVMREILATKKLFTKYVVLRPNESYPSIKSEKNIDLNQLPVSKGVSIGIYTSGTTGIPKLHFHSLESLSNSTKINHTGAVWGLLYPPSRMAGLQVILQALSNKAEIVEPDRNADNNEIISEFLESNVDSISATPSRWKMFLSCKKVEKLPLRQISIGGEIAEQHLLDVISNLFPEAKIRHIYATTETGPVFSVSDGREGFPIELLSRTLNSGKSLAVVNGELVISWPDPTCNKETVVRTGDLVEITNDRVIFVGRRGDMMNVGGVKVSLNEIEKYCYLIPGVVDVQAVSIPNPFMGSVVTVNLQWEAKPLEDRIIREILSRNLIKQAIPAVINNVTSINLTDNFKKKRLL
jgi:acyl-coenzyme A synthetase/AMP-(fatty) acid ligase